MISCRPRSRRARASRWLPQARRRDAERTRRCWSCRRARRPARARRARRARAASAKIIAVTGSVGKTGTKEALRLALSRDGETHASVASYNNHWGVPLSLARCPQSARFAVLRNRHEPRRRDRAADRLVRPHVAIITTIEPVHLEFFGTLEAIADAKAEIFAGLEPGGAAVINRDNPQFARLQRAAKGAGVARDRVVRRTREGRRAARSTARCKPDCSTVHASILGADVTYKLGAPGPAPRAEFARGAGGGEARRRRSCARGAGARRARAADRPRHAHHARCCRAAQRS